MLLSEISRYKIPLLEGIISLFTISEASWSDKWALQVIDSPQFREWLTMCGIGGEIGKQFTGGSVGRAYPIGTNHIVKFTTDANEANAAAVLKGRKLPHTAEIFDVRQVGSKPDPNFSQRTVTLYAILMQRLNTDVSKRMRMAGNAIYSYLDDNSDFIGDPEQVANVVFDKYINDKNRDPSTKWTIQKIVRALYNTQQKTGILSQDPHGGNIAFKGREPAFFDFGRSKMKSGIKSEIDEL